MTMALLQLACRHREKFAGELLVLKRRFSGRSGVRGDRLRQISAAAGRRSPAPFLKPISGGLVLTAKTDEVFAWQQYAAATGRSGDLLIVDEKAEWTVQLPWL